MDEASAREDLAWIRELMVESHEFLAGTWRHQMVWGLVGTVGLLATWLALRQGVFVAVPWTWAVSVGIGWAYSMTAARRGSRRVHNAAGRAFGAVWFALGVTLTLMAALSLSTGAIDPRALPGLIAIVFGAGYFATGALSGLRWLSAVGVAWWVGGAALLLWQTPAGLVALAGMTLALEVGPALVLRRRERDASSNP